MKLPFSFSLKLVFRFLFPGLVLSLALFPVLKVVCDRLCPSIQTEYIITLSTIVTGWLFIVLDMHIYIVLEGRRYWPRWLRYLFQSSEERRLIKCREQYTKVKGVDKIKYVEISVELRRFPLNEDGEPTAPYPTRLGNLISAYEGYPLRVYGMDSIFYWYRIWVSIDEDLREHIDNQQALADSSVYMTVSLFLASQILISYAALQKMQFAWTSNFPEAKTLLFLGGISIFLSYFVYRTSLHLHATFGELYKSIFDIHKDKVKVDSIIEFLCHLTNDNIIKGSSSFDEYKIAWRYLHNYKIKTKNGIVSASTFCGKN